MISNLDKRIEKIKNEHDKITLYVLKNLQKSQDGFIDSLSDIKDILEFDKKSIKEYEVITKTEDIIKGLFNSILNANSKDDIIKIRSSINYYINKIKKVLIERNVPDFLIESYLEKTSYLRKDLAALLRISKRNDNLEKMANLSLKRNSLNKEEVSDFRKLLRNENNYNKRNLVKYEGKKENVNKSFLEPLYFDDNLQVCDVPVIEVEEVEEPINEENKMVKDRFNDIDLSLCIDFTPKFIEPVYNNDYDYLAAKAKKYTKQYGVVDTIDYNKNNRLTTFFKNIPMNVINKGRLKNMKKDYQIYYHGIDLKSYIAYVENRNSIMNGLKAVISNSFIETKKGSCLAKHNECSKWLYDYCQDNSLKMNNKKLVI